MLGLNNVQIIGNLGGTPDMRFLNDGKSHVVNFSVAVNERWKNRDGEPFYDPVFDAVVSNIDGLPNARRRDADALAESVRRAVRAVINEHWGKKPPCLVHVLTV